MRKICSLLGFLVFFSTYNQQAIAQSKNMMDAHDLGTYKYIDLFFAGPINSYENVGKKWSVVASHRKMGAGHDHYHEYKNALCTLVVKSIDAQRLIDNNKNGYRLDAPQSMRAYQASARSLLDESRNYPSAKNCNDLTHAQQLALYRVVGSLIDARNNAYNKFSHQSSNSYKWSNSIGIEWDGLPFKLEIINGTLKFKLATQIGKLKLDYQGGMIQERHSASQGLDWLIIRTPDKKARVFFVKGMNLEFEVPQSTINVRGATMIVTCAEACVRALTS